MNNGMLPRVHVHFYFKAKILYYMDDICRVFNFFLVVPMEHTLATSFSFPPTKRIPVGLIPAVLMLSLTVLFLL